MLDIVLKLSLVVFALAISGNLLRILIGPSMPDRIIALDAVGTNLLAIVALLSVSARSHAYLDIILLIGILAFLGTTAFARYMERGMVIEYDPDRRCDQ